jgi:hypothetical protein
MCQVHVEDSKIDICLNASRCSSTAADIAHTRVFVLKRLSKLCQTNPCKRRRGKKCSTTRRAAAFSTLTRSPYILRSRYIAAAVDENQRAAADNKKKKKGRKDGMLRSHELLEETQDGQD